MDILLICERVLYLRCHLTMTAMIDSLNELKALKELTENLRFLFQNESQLIADGWYSDLEFLYAVQDVVKDYMEKLKE